VSGQLQDKIDYYEFLIDFVSHEIRNPLSAVVMFTRLMKEGAYGELDPRQLEVLDRILANSTRIEHMTDDFLNLSLVENARTYLHPEELDLYPDIIVPAIDALEKKHLFTREQKQAFKNQVKKSVRVWADRRLMNVVIDNLFFNAVKYGREGGEITYGWRTRGEQVVIWVRNEGQGVRKKDLAVIFDKFVRLKDPKIPPKRGTGLGLFNVRRIIEMHGGRIWAESKYGSSFTILFTLPRRPVGEDAVVTPRRKPRPLS